MEVELIKLQQGAANASVRAPFFTGAVIHQPLSPPPPSSSGVPIKPFLLRPLALKGGPKGFGPAAAPSPPRRKQPPLPEDSESTPARKPSPDDDDDEVPQVVTDRMLRRIGFTLGIPLLIGLLFFPFFYYLKMVLKVDVPEWLPLLVSGLFFGSAGFGITYGIVSTSWDPLREGSLLGWKEAQANWPVLLQTWQQEKQRKK